MTKQTPEKISRLFTLQLQFDFVLSFVKKYLVLSQNVGLAKHRYNRNPYSQSQGSFYRATYKVISGLDPQLETEQFV